MMYEKHSQPLLPMRQFIYRFLRHLLAAIIIIAAALGIGIAGYHFFDGLGWVDSFLNASMILGGMGPVNEINSTAAKIFAGFYALFAGLVFIAFASVLLMPFLHRFLHILHMDGKK